MTSQLPRFRWCYCCWQLRKRHQKGAAVMSLRSFSFCDDFNILRFKLLDLISSIVPSVWQKLSRGMSKPTTSKKWENPNIFFFISFHFTSIHFLQKHLISLHSFLFYYFVLPIPSLICYMKDHPWNFGPQVSRAWMWWVWTLHWKVSVTQKVQ